MTGIASITLQPGCFSTREARPTGEFNGVKIGGQPFSSVLAYVEQHLDRKFQEVESEINKARASPRLHDGARIMTVVILVVQEALQKNGTSLNKHAPLPENIDALIKASAKLAMQCKTVKANKWVLTGDLDAINLQVEALARLQSDSAGRKTPFDLIESANQWRMCLDPRKINYIETQLSGGRNNPLLRFLFDNESSYLYGMMHGWKTSMDSLNDPLDADLVVKLYAGCFKSSSAKDVSHVSPSIAVNLDLGNNMTKAGLTQLVEFAKDLRQYLPPYAVVGSLDDYRDYEHRLRNAPSGVTVVPRVSVKETGVLFRPAITAQIMKKAIQHYLAIFSSRCQADPQGKNTTRHIAELCQSLEQLHPFPDGNCRTFGVILLNHLLVRHGLPMSMLDDPNILDGWSLDEVVKEIKKGQKNVAEWTPGQKTNSNTAVRKAAALQARLTGLFLKGGR